MWKVALLCVYTVDCKDAADWPDVMRAMCRAFSLDEMAANENLVVGAILQQLRRSGCRKLVLLLLRVHGLDPTRHRRSEHDALSPSPGCC